MLFVLAFLVSLLPYIALYRWLQKARKEDPEYRRLCRRALGHGVLSVVAVVLPSGISSLVLRLTGVQKTSPLLYEALYTFIVLAFMEELVKLLFFRRILRRNAYAYPPLDTSVLMTIVGIGFGLLEAAVYAIGASIPEILLRGICLPHAGYGFIVGYFCGKAERVGKPVYTGVGFLIAWLLHGIYDFSLSEEFIALNEDLAAISLLLALLDIVLVILLVVYVKKALKREIACETSRE